MGQRLQNCLTEACWNQDLLGEHWQVGELKQEIILDGGRAKERTAPDLRLGGRRAVEIPRDHLHEDLGDTRSPK